MMAISVHICNIRVTFSLILILCATLSYCENSLHSETSFNNFYPEVWRKSYVKEKSTDEDEQQKTHKAEVIALLIVCFVLLMCLFIPVFLCCYKYYFKNQPVNNPRVVFHQLPSPTAYALSPAHVFWQPFTESLIASLPPNYQQCPTRDNTSRSNTATTIKPTQQSQQSVVAPFQPVETPPPPYQETTEVNL